MAVALASSSGRSTWQPCRAASAQRPRGRAARAGAVDVRAPAPATAGPRAADPPGCANQRSREGSYEAPLVYLQASKDDPEQPALSDVLPPLEAGGVADVAVVGCGPAGLALAAELGSQGLSVALVSRESKFVNNYGVWLDEFKALGLEHTLDATWGDAVCYFKEGREVRVGRAYGRVCRRRLRQHLLERCLAAGVRFLAAEVTGVEPAGEGRPVPALRTAGDGPAVAARLVVLASGAAAGRLLRYEGGAPAVAAQTAYGIEAEVEGYDAVYDPQAMLFMDFRRHHTGLHGGAARRLVPEQHPLGGDGLWGTDSEVPSFLYAMPLGGSRVFLEETCLVARPALPFAMLKRRLERRCEALGIKVKEVHEEEWSYIPVGGPLPLPDQPVVAFGAAANLVHPATGYSITRSLREAPGMAAAIQRALAEQSDPAGAARYVWEALWSQEKRRQASFHVFGMELLCQLDVTATADFFTTFFALPALYWRGFLASQLSSAQLLVFAMLTFVLAPWGIKARLVAHLLTDPAGQYLIRTYTGSNREQWQQQDAQGGAALAAAAATLALLAAAAEHGSA
eukprot:scaffold6.g2802.t1